MDKPNSDAANRTENMKKKLQKKLFEKGTITETEYNLLQSSNRSANNIRKQNDEIMQMNKEIEEMKEDEDYLDANDLVALKYGCVSFYSPSFISGLGNLCFKVRGLFEERNELMDRVNVLKKLYPHDRIYIFELGKWTPYVDDLEFDAFDLCRQLNYAMKCYFNNMKKETEEFEERKKKMMDENKNQNETVSGKKKKHSKSGKKQTPDSGKDSVKNSVKKETSDDNIKSKKSDHDFSMIGNEKDNQEIDKIYQELNDDEITGKFVITDKSKLEKMEINL
jgi:hypothetical protein